MKFSLKAFAGTLLVSTHTTVELVLASPLNFADRQPASLVCAYRTFCPTSLAEGWCVSWDTGFAMCEQKNGKYPTEELRRCKACVESNCATTGCDEVM
ncbi:hypothetical protein EMPG_17880 [Blastomyces silverae]|uniref:Uncharacterized protein n=1 Tax=Blastomyces silverae TaxID=2060906 RepID=A0A0H1BBK0_9EURO|nr:hypothetical protein EMPG_17880 [Blastomyces silverae]